MDHRIKSITVKTIKHSEYRSKLLWPWVKQSLLRFAKKDKLDYIEINLFYKQYHQESEKTIYKAG